jgi:hypothetical protein
MADDAAQDLIDQKLADLVMDRRNGFACNQVAQQPGAGARWRSSRL